MAELLAVACKLLKENENPPANVRRRRSRADKMLQLKTKIDEFHNLLIDAERRQQSDQHQVTVNDVLEGAEKQQQNDEIVKKWLDRVKDVYYKVIDVCKELRMQEMRVQEKRKGQPLSCSSPLRQCTEQIHDEILEMIGEILKDVEDLSEQKDKLGLKPAARILQRSPTATMVHDKEPLICGRDREKKSIIPRMYHRRKEVQLISIIGETGIGKTTVAQLVYEEVKAHFDQAAWVNVSDEFSELRIARDFLESITSKKINKIELQTLFQRVREIIKGRRYLLVLDGVQKEKDFEKKWEKLMEVFNCGVPGCTILMTAHLEDNAAVAKQSACKMRLAPLEEKHCWSIITDRVFGTEKTVDKQIIYEEVGKELVKKCNGLPVIAKTIGDVLRDRTLVSDWQLVLRSDIWETALKDKPYAMKATILSYYCLSSDSRQCLLYCAMFPKNQYIDVNKLINVWMAQDSIGLESDQAMDIESQAWSRFKELLDSSIFQDYFKQDDSGNFKCRLPGVMSDFLHDLAGNECRIVHLDKPEFEGEAPRHCTLNVLPQASLPPSIPKSEKLHTLMLLSEYSPVDPATLSSLLRHMKRLRALDLSYCSMQELPPRACELLHLRYLDLSFNRDLKKLPQAICNLLNLQTLNLNGCDDLRELPKGIGKLTKLRHLDILWTSNLSYLPKGLTSLTSLRRLTRFFGGSDVDKNACSLADLQHLKNLQGYITLEGLGSKSSASQAADAGLKDRKGLIGLELWFSVVESKSDDQHVLEGLEPNSGLQCLGIFYYRGNSFPSWMIELEKLKHLILADCNECDALPSLGKLRLLESLEIKNMAKVEKVGVEFLGSAADSAMYKDAFPKLRKLHFEKLDNWKEWDASDDRREHMTSLSFLSIVSCPKLETLPHYITVKKKKENFTTEPKDLVDFRTRSMKVKGVQKQ